MTELKPCPFCGDDEVRMAKIDALTDWYYVVCKSCEADGPTALTEANATAAWNTRVHFVEGGEDD